MSEKLCLQWNDFKENVYSACGSLRNDKEFTDVTLACEDGQQLEAHKVILAFSTVRNIWGLQYIGAPKFYFQYSGEE